MEGWTPPHAILVCHSHFARCLPPAVVKGVTDEAEQRSGCRRVASAGDLSWSKSGFGIHGDIGRKLRELRLRL